MNRTWEVYNGVDEIVRERDGVDRRGTGLCVCICVSNLRKSSSCQRKKYQTNK